MKTNNRYRIQFADKIYTVPQLAALLNIKAKHLYRFTQARNKESKVYKDVYYLKDSITIHNKSTCVQ